MNLRKRIMPVLLAVTLLSVFFPTDIRAAAGKYPTGTPVFLNPEWTYASYSVLHAGNAVYYAAPVNTTGKVIAVNAGHGTIGGTKYKTYCHPDMTPKVTGGSTAKGAIKATAVSGGMTFADGTGEAVVTLRLAQIFRDKLLAAGYDVLMIRDGADVNLDNIARTVISNNVADCHIALHFDGDGLSYNKGCFYMSTPDGLKTMAPVSGIWQMHELLGTSLIGGLAAAGQKINGKGSMAIDLTQTSYSTIPSVDIELGNQCADHSEAALMKLADGLVAGVNLFYGR
ncbi:MAG: N-acetylmuramoyl-L-alanine amidase [Lachnospiraceae bacterium]|nr:N-acetylmuramoyl-L-alanine amidase [Lachnospiraceae bacterium]